MLKKTAAVFPLLLACLALSGALFAIGLDTAKFRLAEKFYNQNNHRKALDECRDLIANHPYSGHVPRALLIAGKSSLALNDFEKASRYFSVLEKRAVKESDKRQALFGFAQSSYRLGRWKDAAVAYMNFGMRYKDSPVAPAALFYAGRSLDAMNLQGDAQSVYQTLAREYPGSPYAREARTPAASPEPPSRPAVPETPDLNVVDLSGALRTITNTVVITNLFQPDGPAQFPETREDYSVRRVEISNTVVLTQTVVMIDTNEQELERAYRENRRTEEEIDRFRALVELKAKLLEMKEKAVREKNELLYENPDEGTSHE